MFFVYVIYSELSGRYYKGRTQHLQLRLKAHNQGKVRSTKKFRPWKLVYYETFSSLKEASDREVYFKSAAGRRFLKKILPDFLVEGFPPDR